MAHPLLVLDEGEPYMAVPTRVEADARVFTSGR
jgi:hypothetical protein